MTKKSEISDRKNDFPLLVASSLIYLDSAATAQKPKAVLNAMDHFARQRYAAVHRGLYPLATVATQEFEAARKTVAEFINADVGEIIFTKGTTDGINGLSRSVHAILPPKRKKILLTEMEHHANIIPWQQFAKQHGYTLDYIPITKECTLDMSLVKSKLTSDVALLCITHASNVVGTINPVADICKLAKAAGITTIIDGAQAIAHVPVDVKKIDCDFYVFSGHKLYGPTGIGIIYGRRQLLEKIPPFIFGGHMIESASKYDANWAAIPHRFEAGTQPIIEAVGLAAAIKYVEEIDMGVIAKHDTELARHAIDKLSQIKGIKTFAGEPNCGIISFELEGAHAHDIASLLGDKKICIRAGHHCAMPLTQVLAVPATARISFGVHNTQEDIDSFITALTQIQKLFSDR